MSPGSRESVDAVNEIKCIDDDQDREHGQENGWNDRDCMNPNIPYKLINPAWALKTRIKHASICLIIFYRGHGKDGSFSPNQKYDDKSTQYILQIPEYIDSVHRIIQKSPRQIWLHLQAWNNFL
jgi:hypothetical protein